MATDSIPHIALTKPFLYLWIASTLLPFLVWAVVASVARRQPEILPRMYPLIKVLAWGFWALTAAGTTYYLFARPGKIFFVRYAVLLPLSFGIQLFHGWMRRRVDPDSFKKQEGWWPTPKDSANTSEPLR